MRAPRVRGPRDARPRSAPAFVGALLGGLLLALIAVGVAVGVLLRRGVSIKASKRRKQFEEQLPDSLALIAGGLRAGHSLPQAIDALVQEAESPTCDEFRRALFETQLGHTLPEALRAARRPGAAARTSTGSSRRSRSRRDVGGDLAAVLDNVTRTIRDRTRVRRQIDTLTAEGRLSAIVLFALPILMFIFMAIVEPGLHRRAHRPFAGIVMLRHRWR